MGMPRIEVEFEFDMVFCFGLRLAPCAVFFFFFFFFFNNRFVQLIRITSNISIVLA